MASVIERSISAIRDADNPAYSQCNPPDQCAHNRLFVSLYLLIAGEGWQQERLFFNRALNSWSVLFLTHNIINYCRHVLEVGAFLVCNGHYTGHHGSADAC